MLINVEIPNSGKITQIDDSLLTKKEYVQDTQIDTWSITEYWLDGACVHRSAHMTVNKQKVA